MNEWQPFREPLRRTLTRTVSIALVAGGVFAFRHGGLARWPAASAVALWPSLGGHWLELWFLNWLRPRLADRRAAQVAARLATWFAGGVALAAGMWLTAVALPGLRPPRAAWWFAGVAGLAFVGVELAAHLAVQLRWQPSFFNGRG
jgi:hypothetical protein